MMARPMEQIIECEEMLTSNNNPEINLNMAQAGSPNVGRNKRRAFMTNISKTISMEDRDVQEGDKFHISSQLKQLKRNMTQSIEFNDRTDLSSGTKYNVKLYIEQHKYIKYDQNQHI